MPFQATAGALAAGSAVSGAFGLGNGQSGHSESQGGGINWGYGGSNSANSSYDWSIGGGYGYSNDIGESWGRSESSGIGEQYGRTFGREASAQDILNAREANMIQKSMFSDQAAYNSREAAKNRAWQEYMSNTAYQRAVLDLKAAGLNPILAVGNMGASTPTGGAASAGLAQSAKANATAEQTSGGYYRTNSASSNYSYNKGNSYNQSYNRSEGRSSGWSKSWEENGGVNYNKATSDWTNNAREIVTTAADFFKAWSPKNITKAIDRTMKSADVNNLDWGYGKIH